MPSLVFILLGRLGFWVPRIEPNVEVNLHGLLGLGKSDISDTILEAERDEDILRLKTTPSEFSSFFRGQFQSLISKHATEPLSVILQLEPEKLVRSANVPISRETCVSPLIAKESIVKPISKSLDLSGNVNFITPVVASKHNEEVGISVTLDDVAELVAVGSKRVLSGLDDVVVSLSVHEKGDGLDSSFATGEEAAGRGAWYAEEYLLLRSWGKLTIDVLLSIQRILSRATRPKQNGFPPGICSIASQASVCLRGYILLSEADIILSRLALGLAWLLVFLPSLVGICSLHDVVVHRSLLLGRR
ncbi:hypothetical protein Tco_0541406 [Tanacetum coccineum]